MIFFIFFSDFLSHLFCKALCDLLWISAMKINDYYHYYYYYYKDERKAPSYLNTGRNVNLITL